MKKKSRVQGGGGYGDQGYHHHDSGSPKARMRLCADDGPSDGRFSGGFEGGKGGYGGGRGGGKGGHKGRGGRGQQEGRSYAAGHQPLVWLREEEGPAGDVRPRWRVITPTGHDHPRPGAQLPFQKGGQCVLQWIGRDQRVDDSWAAIEATRCAAREGVPHHVCFTMLDSFYGAGHRQFNFMIGGLRELEQRCRELGIGFTLLRARGTHSKAKGGPPDPGTVVADFAAEMKAGVVVSDFSPLRDPIRWRRTMREVLSPGVPAVEVDSHNIVPCWICSDRQERSASSIRPKLEALATRKAYLTEYPSIDELAKGRPRAPAGEKIDWDAVEDSIPCDRSIPPVSWAKPGHKAGMERLNKYCASTLKAYDEHRMEPNMAVTSMLSPWLHYGMISSQRCVLTARASGFHCPHFVEEIMVRRELCDNHCLYQPQYGTMDAAAPWVRETLAEHERDRRDYVYTQDEFEHAQTHDGLWNACQNQMVQTGHMHGWLRMYWAKKILEWCKRPADALRIAIYLNDKYELDGRDPNGYVGVQWCIIGTHDRMFDDRPVIGKLRYFSMHSTRKKFNVDEFVRKWAP